MKEFIGRGGELIGPLDAGVNQYFQGFRSAGVKVYGLEKAELMEFLQWLAEQRGYRTEDTPSSISGLNFRPFVCTNAQTGCVREIHRLISGVQMSHLHQLFKVISPKVF